MTNRERAERWVADRTTKGFYSPTTTDSLTALLDEGLCCRRRSCCKTPRRRWPLLQKGLAPRGELAQQGQLPDESDGPPEPPPQRHRTRDRHEGGPS